jgi:hypothetical protein
MPEKVLVVFESIKVVATWLVIIGWLGEVCAGVDWLVGATAGT